MTLARLTFYSDVLRRDTHVNVIYPQVNERTPDELKDQIKPPYPVLYLLHGLSGNEDSFIRFTSLERYARDLPLVIVMPTTDRLFYVNNEAGYNYGDYITQELPALMADTFNIKQDRESTFIAGASMGGYGALNAAFKYPEKYGYVAGLSSLIDIQARYQMGPDPQSPADFHLLFGQESPAGTDKDITHLIDQAIQKGQKLPQVWLACGLQDGLISQNRAFKHQYQDQLTLQLIEAEGGHDWLFWDQYVQELLTWLPL
ncbi:alpha/beta hydrolase [Ignavigranum ruoffiae]|uniref:S-formylglutathione hydrolase FrmB n=1 Tax=Ignavigranum ruoffiae TaxID=89093 RepID=A0A1H9FJ42_9LACT|nr:alpha/beta hydrolase family protein [Ignavigranum ruoffiae]SEQ37980.1 S-formylglutathione hydrolase FrmB [Ignavigranum ruoffiae]